MTLHLLVRNIRIVLLSLLAAMLVVVSNAQMRSTVMVTLLESGATRFYETEVHQPSTEVTVQRESRMGRKPYDHLDQSSTFVPLPRVLRITSRDLVAAGCRAPPYAPRAPPVLA